MDALANIHWEVIFQLVCIGLIVVSGPIVIFVLAFRNGNL
ncbi:photosystem II reaction center protein Ycf12 [Cronbergia sp. UHCC 0137]|nr:photosystem II reaction center protein Ycf12 [Cronbergia sp. UHCC 0137]MEA5617285.1 photosystem II reaction center protein Ycf12 [Cronbergia sp. UHCC 0137]